MSVAMAEFSDWTGTGTALAGRSISVIVSAMNEEGNLKAAVDSVVGAVAPRFPNYEVIIVDDGSSDRTPQIAAALAAANPHIRVHRNPENLGLGRSYRIGIELAGNEYTSWVAGNNLIPQEALERIYDRVGERDMVISYVISDVRGFRRRAMSRAFTICMNFLFSVDMRYYTGPNVYKTAVAKRLPMCAQGSLFVAELLVRLLRANQSYVEVGLQPLSRSAGSTKTFRLWNVVDVFSSVMCLFWELRVHRASPSANQSEIRVVDNDPAVPSR